MRKAQMVTVMMQNEEGKEYLLTAEVEAAQKAKVAYDQYFLPFYEKEAVVLFDLFRAAPIGDKDAIVDIHHRFKVLDSHMKSLLTTIETGLLASSQLEQIAKEKEDAN